MRSPLGIPAEYRPLATKAAAVLLLSVLIAVVVGISDGLGLGSDSDADSWHTSATVTSGTPCDNAEPRELVSFVQDGQSRVARLDACGHRAGEVLGVAVPVAADGEQIVRLDTAATGATNQGRPVGLFLLVLAGVAGAGYAELWRNSRVPVTPADKPVS